MGERIIMTIRINPIGFQYNDPERSPFERDKIDRVAPQEGQGI